jgi:hypothetical protein
MRVSNQRLTFVPTELSLGCLVYIGKIVVSGELLNEEKIKRHTGLLLGLFSLGLLRGLRLGLICQLLKLGMESCSSSIDDWAKEVLAESGSVALGNAGTDTFRHCKEVVVNGIIENDNDKE